MPSNPRPRYLSSGGIIWARSGGLFKLVCAVAETPGGDVYVLGTEREWLEIRITASGLIRVGAPVRGRHVYFTPEPTESDAD